MRKVHNDARKRFVPQTINFYLIYVKLYLCKIIIYLLNNNIVIIYSKFLKEYIFIH